MNNSKGKLPGEELIEEGLHDLSKQIISPMALLVLIGAPRLKRMGIQIPTLTPTIENPEKALYDNLNQTNPRNAHSAYNALIRRLVSYERCLERQRSSK